MPSNSDLPGSPTHAAAISLTALACKTASADFASLQIETTALNALTDWSSELAAVNFALLASDVDACERSIGKCFNASINLAFIVRNSNVANIFLTSSIRGLGIDSWISISTGESLRKTINFALRVTRSRFSINACLSFGVCSSA